ncbi:UNVERIFIED_CONTAM: hypothetical protein Sradi_5116900 [Sesamum radiatum]|uniref:Uncharacterized protein n=1 Tax=Sesamum radiatum TaxID=300843 RepID=A0AAW2M4R8_SESRA
MAAAPHKKATETTLPMVWAPPLSWSGQCVRIPEGTPYDFALLDKYNKRSAEAVGCKNTSVGERSALEGSP